MSQSESQGWKVLASEEGYRSPYLQVMKEHVRTPSRPEGVHWTVARRASAAIVAPRTTDGKYVLIKQERVAVQQAMWEFPAGQVDGAVSEETIRETALRELGEETGLECRGELIPLGYFFSPPGFTDERGYLFLATNVEPREGGASHDEHEAILEVGEFTIDELREMISTGEISDANTQVTYARLHARGLIS
ncbi:hypothetical protein BH09VER1_BH09VER1_50150 [soil metagenome]